MSLFSDIWIQNRVMERGTVQLHKPPHPQRFALLGLLLTNNNLPFASTTTLTN